MVLVVIMAYCACLRSWFVLWVAARLFDRYWSSRLTFGFKFVDWFDRLGVVGNWLDVYAFCFFGGWSLVLNLHVVGFVFCLHNGLI